jgi:hypothetical protein
MKFARKDYSPFTNKLKPREKREPLYKLTEIADMVGIEYKEIHSKILSASSRGLPIPKAELHVAGGSRYYIKSEVIKFLKEYK